MGVFMLETKNGENFYGEYNDNTIKISRKKRNQKLEVKQYHHKQNPKSVAYYKDLKEEPQHNQINNTEKNTIKEMDETMKTNESTLVKSSIKKETNDLNNTGFGKKSKNIVKKKSPPKYKAGLESYSSALEKIFKRDGVFLNFNTPKGTITVLKDFPTSVSIGKVKTALSLRCLLGEFELKNSASNNKDTFGLIKAEFSKWLNNAITAFDSEKEFNNFYQPFINSIKKDKILSVHLPNLEGRLINMLRKSSKQPHGFIPKMNQIISLWKEEANEVYYIEQVESQLNFKSFEQSFPLARSMKRKFSIFVGKTNSGKTYSAMNALAQADNGVYLAPLRLMAQEGQESLFERNRLANLITGEEQKIVDGASHVSSTVEMCNMTKPVQVAVIDEIQMIADDSRGWAWSQALVGVPAQHVILVGSEESLPFILPIIKSLGEEYEIQRFERKTPLHTHDGIKKFKELKAGDCVVVFSRKTALEMKNAIEATGKKCSVIYGNLSPDVRRSEANKFKSGENPILVATDAIGMGLNLPISRLFFSTIEKFDGIETRVLNVSEIKQIAGRAGRYGFAQFGEVGLLMNDNQHDKSILHTSMFGEYDKATDTRVPIAPNLKQIQTICDTIGKDDLYASLIFFKEKMIKGHNLYKTANLEDMIELASLLKAKNLDLSSGLTYACVPIDTNSEVHMKNFFKWVNTHIAGKEVAAPVIPDVIELQKNDSYSLFEAENYVKICMAYRWLHYKYPDIYNDIETVIKNAKVTNEYIEKTLHHHVVISKNPRWKRF